MDNLEKYNKLVSERDAKIQSINDEYKCQLSELKYQFTLGDLDRNGWKFKCWFGLNNQDLFEKNGTLLRIIFEENDRSKIIQVMAHYNGSKLEIIDLQHLEDYYKSDQSFRALNIKKVTQL